MTAESPHPTPRRIRLEASSFCQLRCPSCPTTTGAIHPAVGSGFLRLDDFRRLVDANPGLERIELSNYGEVFLNRQLPDILAYAHGKGVAITIENGANLSHARPEALEAVVAYGVRVLTVSIDGASPATYARYRVGGDFDAVLANVATINAHKRRLGRAQPHLVWQLVVFGHNEHELPEARRMAAELGMEFRPKLTWDDGFSPLRDPERVRAALGGATTREEWARLHGHPYAHAICAQLWDDPQINFDGKVLGCCRNFWGDFGGNAFTDGLAASLNHERMVYARAMLEGRAPPRVDVPCTTCELYVAMRDGSAFVTSSARPPVEDPAETTRREIDARLADVDAVLARTSWLGRKMALRSARRLALAPAFASGFATRQTETADFPSPAVSVILPTRNRAPVLADAIASVQAQTFRDWELLVVDDASSDRTAEVMRAFADDPRVRYLPQAAGGHAVTRNRGIAAARGALFAYLDSDNIWFPSFLAAAVCALAVYPATDCVYGMLLTEAHLAPARAATAVLFQPFDRARLLDENFIDINTVVHRRRLVDAYGVFDEHLERLVDWDLLLRYTQDAPARRIPVLAARYRIVDAQRVTSTRPLEPSRSAIRGKWRTNHHE
jgi:hypothetical protein